MDWRWAGNTLREAAQPGWFGEHGRIFRKGGEIGALAISETGQGDVCVLTGDEDPTVVEHALAWVEDHWIEDRAVLEPTICDEAAWLIGLVEERGFEPERTTGYEWAYDLAGTLARLVVSDGFVVASCPHPGRQTYGAIRIRT